MQSQRKALSKDKWLKIYYKAKQEDTGQHKAIKNQTKPNSQGLHVWERTLLHFLGKSEKFFTMSPELGIPGIVCQTHVEDPE